MRNNENIHYEQINCKNFWSGSHLVCNMIKISQEDSEVIEISIFSFVMLTIGCLWLGGALVLGILAYLEYNEANPDNQIVSDILAILRYAWEIKGLGASRATKFSLTVVFWILYPILLALFMWGNWKERWKKMAT